MTAGLEKHKECAKCPMKRRNMALRRKYLPGNVDGHILMRCSGEDAEQLVEDCGQEVDHHMSLHCMKTLKKIIKKPIIFANLSF